MVSQINSKRNFKNLKNKKFLFFVHSVSKFYHYYNYKYISGSFFLEGFSILITGFKGCVEEFLVNSEYQPTSGYSNKYDIVSNEGVSATCTAYLQLAGKDGPPQSVVIIVICVFFALLLIGTLAILLIILYRRRKREKKQHPNFTQNGAAIFSNGTILGKTKMNNDSGRSHPDSGIAEDENQGINEHAQNEINNRVFDEREIRSSLNSNRPDIVASDMLGDRNAEESDDGIDNTGYSDGPPEHYDLDNASSIAPSDLLDYTQHYKRYRLGQVPSHNNKYKNGHKHMHPRHTPSPSVLANRQSPASVSMQLGRQSPADYLGRTTPQKSQLTVENVNQLNRQTPVNQLSRASPAPNIPVHRGPGVPTSMRSTPLSGISGLYPSNISNSTGYSDTPPGIPNGHIRGRPNSKLKQPINQVGLRNTPTKGLTIEEVHRLNGRHTPTTLDAISSSSEEDIKNNINQTDFTHSDLLEPSNSMLPPESSSEEETNDSFTCSEFEDDSKIRNDRMPARNFSRLPRVNEHDDTDTTLNSRSRNLETDSNRESHTSTFFTASEEDFPRKITNTKLTSNLMSLDSMLNWGANYEKLVGVFNDIAHLSRQPEAMSTPKRTPHQHQKTGSMSSDISHNSSAQAAPQQAFVANSVGPYLPPKPSRVASPGMRVTGGRDGPLKHRRSSPLPPSPLVSSSPQHHRHSATAALLNGHVKQSSIASIASSHDRQSSVSSVHSSRSGRPPLGSINHHHQPSNTSSHHQHQLSDASSHHQPVNSSLNHQHQLSNSSLNQHQPFNGSPHHQHQPSNSSLNHQFQPSHTSPHHQHQPSNSSPHHQSQPSNSSLHHQHQPSNTSIHHQHQPSNASIHHQHQPSNASSSHLQVLPSHSRSSSRSSLSSSRQPIHSSMYNPNNPQPPPPPPSIAQAIKVVEGKTANGQATTPAKEEYV